MTILNYLLQCQDNSHGTNLKQNKEYLQNRSKEAIRQGSTNCDNDRHDPNFFKRWELFFFYFFFLHFLKFQVKGDGIIEMFISHLEKAEHQNPC
jgi:hypothetical protein